MNSAIRLHTKEHIATIEHYKQALSLLSWDAKTSAPLNSQKQHATIQGTLSKEFYLLQTDPAFAKELQHLQEQNLSQIQQNKYSTIGISIKNFPLYHWKTIINFLF